MKIRRTSLMLLALALPSFVAGQVPDVGDRLRIENRSGTEWTGTLQAHSPEGLTLIVDEETRVFPASEIAGLERSLGEQRNFRKYFGITLTSVGLIGILTFAATKPGADDCTGGRFCPTPRWMSAIEGLWVGGLVGVPVGVVVGLTKKEERWEPLSMGGQQGTTVSIRPIVGDRIGLGATIRLGR